MEQASPFSVFLTDNIGRPIGVPLIAHAGKGNRSKSGDDGFARRFVARQIATAALRSVMVPAQPLRRRPAGAKAVILGPWAAITFSMVAPIGAPVEAEQAIDGLVLGRQLINGQAAVPLTHQGG